MKSWKAPVGSEMYGHDGAKSRAKRDSDKVS